jgi:hypothetical protein
MEKDGVTSEWIAEALANHALAELYPYKRSVQCARLLTPHSTSPLFHQSMVLNHLRADKRVLLSALKWHDPVEFSIGDDLWNDSEFVTMALNVNCNVVHHAPTRMKEDEDFLLAALQSLDNRYNKHVDFLYKNNIKQRRQHIEAMFKTIPEKFTNSRSFILKATDVLETTCPMRHASIEIQSDRDFVLSVAARHPGVILDLLPQFRSDYQVVFTVVSHPKFHDNEGIKYLSEDLRNNYFIAHAAVLFAPFSLSEFDERLRDDFLIVETAVRENGSSIECASERLRDDYSIARAAVTESPDAFEYVSPRLKDDREFVLYATSLLESLEHFDYDYCILEWCSDTLRADRDFVLAVVNLYPWSFLYASEEVRADTQVFVETSTQLITHPHWKGDYGGELLDHVPSHRFNDREFISSAIEVDPYAYNVASDELKQDRDLCLRAIIRSKDVEMKQSIFERAPNNLRNDPILQSWVALPKGKTLWRIVRERHRILHICEFMVALTMRATFDIDGRATMVGCGARRMRKEVSDICGSDQPTFVRP